MMTDSSRVAMLVLGMHRSGTSALTRILGHLGCALPADGIAAHADNATGYWEPEGLVRECDRVFRTARSSWFDPRPLDLAGLPPPVFVDHRDAFARAIAASFGGADRIAVKDPRLSRLVPLAVPALAELGYEPGAVLVLRRPAEIAASLGARDRSTPNYAYALWLRHMIDAERDTRRLPRVVASYDRLLADWRAELWPVIDLLFPDGHVVDDATEAAIDAHLDRDLRHHGPGSEPSLEPWLAPLMAEAEAAFARLGTRDDEAARAGIDAVAAAFDAPRLIDDVIHDELRHRRHREIARGWERDVVAVHALAEAQEAEDEAAIAGTATLVGAPQAEVAPPAPGTRDIAGEATLIRASGLFDAAWYLERYPDVAETGADPVVHYLTVGAAEGRDPNPLFHTAYYARQMARRALLRQGEA